jgi:hypothetical protein
MILRVMHSLIPTLVAGVGNVTEEQEKLSFDFLPGAKEVFQLGAQAIGAEYNHAFNEESKRAVQQAINSGDYETGVRVAKDGFLSDFNPMGIQDLGGGPMGGRPWQAFAQALLNLNDGIKRAEANPSPQNFMQLSAYLNVIDGLAHNTGSFMEKMMEQEGMGKDEVSTWVSTLTNMRDATRLENPQDIINLVGPLAPYAPKEYREHLKRHVGLRGGDYRGTPPEESLERLREDQRRRGVYKEPVPKLRPAPKKPPAPPRPKAAKTLDFPKKS